MNKYRERRIAYLEEELSMLKHSDIPMKEIDRRLRYVHHKELFNIENQLNILTEKIDNLSVKSSVCAMSQDNIESSGILKLITGLPNKRKQERKYLQHQISGARKLRIVDPYFLSWSGPNKIYTKEKEYINFILELIPSSVKELEIYHLPGANNRIKINFNKIIRSRKIKVRYIETNQIHDRVFIKNDEEAILVGTSIGGFGNKIAFILDIPNEDLDVFIKELEKLKN